MFFVTSLLTETFYLLNCLEESMEGINYGNLKQSIQGMRREVQLC